MRDSVRGGFCFCGGLYHRGDFFSWAACAAGEVSHCGCRFNTEGVGFDSPERVPFSPASCAVFHLPRGLFSLWGGSYCEEKRVGICRVCRFSFLTGYSDCLKGFGGGRGGAFFQKAPPRASPAFLYARGADGAVPTVKCRLPFGCPHLRVKPLFRYGKCADLCGAFKDSHGKPR